MKFGRFANSHLFGREQETKAAGYLRTYGLKLIGSNYHSRFGEIDLIMLEKSTLVFIEVRFRRSNNYGSPIATVSLQKQKKIRLTAAHFLQKHEKFQHLNCRFDVIGLSCLTGSAKYKFDWIKNAFS